MKINHTFCVTISANKYPKLDKSISYEGTLKDKIEKVDIKLSLDERSAADFLFKFSPSIFILDGYTIGMKYDKYHKLKNIVLTKDNNVYVVTNMIKLFSDIHEGYFRILTMNKINDIMEFDFNLEEDYDDIHEEFEDDEEE